MPCPATREHRAAQGMAGYGCSPCHVPDLAVLDGQAPLPVRLFFVSAVHTHIHGECCQFDEASCHSKERAGGAQSLLCATPTAGHTSHHHRHVQEWPAPSACQVESTCAVRVISPTSSRASAARLNGAVRALAKARPLLCAAAACLACTHAHHYYDCLSLFLHRPLCVLLLHPRPVIPPPPSPTLPPRHALTGYACAPPANILRGW